MKADQHLVSESWADYELLDSGENMKLERYGEVIIARPETQALWKKSKPELWSDAHAEFSWSENKGDWKRNKPIPESWQMARDSLKFIARLTSFKHTGVFPEQAPNWDWIAAHVRDVVRPTSDVGRTTSNIPNILNLFGYTGIASLAAASVGAFVTHVDASKQSLDWAHENARLSGIPEDRVRWIPEDALSFVKREVRRGAKYDGIILDPPAFGRGAKGEVWKIEEDLLLLLTTLHSLLSDKPGSFFLLNGYAAGYSPLSFAQAVESVFGKVEGGSGELRIAEKDSGRAIPAGIYVRFVR